MYKTLLTYSGFTIICFAVIAVFITATTYTQLGVAVILYPLLVFFGYRLILPKLKRYTPKKQPEIEPETFQAKKSLGIADTDKRTFLKIIGATGISFLLISLFSRKFESFLFSQNSLQGPASTGSIPANQVSTASPTDGYNISEVDDSIVSYYGFINQTGGWFIMKGDTNSGSYRYAKGTSNFPYSWNNRKNLKYNYFYEVFSY